MKSEVGMRKTDYRSKAALDPLFRLLHADNENPPRPFTGEHGTATVTTDPELLAAVAPLRVPRAGSGKPLDELANEGGGLADVPAALAPGALGVAQGEIGGDVAGGAECLPLAAGAAPAPKLDSKFHANFLLMLPLQLLKLLFVLLVIVALPLQCRLKLAYLSLKLRYLGFAGRRLVERQRQAFADDVRHGQVFKGIAGDVEKAHGAAGEVSPATLPGLPVTVNAGGVR